MECILLTASNEIKDLGIILLLELKRELILNGEFRKAKLALRDKVLFFFFLLEELILNLWNFADRTFCNEKLRVITYSVRGNC